MAAFEADHVLSDNWCSGGSSIELLAEPANFATKPSILMAGSITFAQDVYAVHFSVVAIAQQG